MDTTIEEVRRELAAATWDTDCASSLASVLARKAATEARIARALAKSLRTLR